MSTTPAFVVFSEMLWEHLAATEVASAAPTSLASPHASRPPSPLHYLSAMRISHACVLPQNRRLDEFHQVEEDLILKPASVCARPPFLLPRCLLSLREPTPVTSELNHYEVFCAPSSYRGPSSGHLSSPAPTDASHTKRALHWQSGGKLCLLSVPPAT